MKDDESGNMPGAYDRLLGGLHGLPDVLATKPSTVRTVEPIIGHSNTFVVQTYRQRDVGDFVFLEAITRDGVVRLVLPPSVADTIARQRDALTTKARQKAARAAAKTREERGDIPFQKKAS